MLGTNVAEGLELDKFLWFLSHIVPSSLMLIVCQTWDNKMLSHIVLSRPVPLALKVPTKIRAFASNIFLHGIDEDLIYDTLAFKVPTKI